MTRTFKTIQSAGWNELHDWMEQLSVKMKGIENEEGINKEKLDKLLQWLLAKQGLVYIIINFTGRKLTSNILKCTTGLKMHI